MMLANPNKKEQEIKKGTRLDKRQVTFKIALENDLHNDYSFRQLKGDSIKNFQRFLDETVYKGLTITQVDSLYLRTKGPVKESCEINGEKRDIVHYGKDRNPLRVHGYFNEKNYFVIYKIDPKHNVHRE